MRKKLCVYILAFCNILIGPSHFSFVGPAGPNENLPSVTLPENTELARYIGHKLGIDCRRIKVMSRNKVIKLPKEAESEDITFAVNSYEKAVWDEIDPKRIDRDDLYLTYKPCPEGRFHVSISFDFDAYTRQGEQEDYQEENILLKATHFVFYQPARDLHSCIPLSAIKPEAKSRLILDIADHVYPAFAHLEEHGIPEFEDTAFYEWLNQKNAQYYFCMKNCMGIANINLGNGFMMSIAKRSWKQTCVFEIADDDRTKELFETHKHARIYKDGTNIMRFHTNNNMSRLNFCIQMACRLPALFPDDIFMK